MIGSGCSIVVSTPDCDSGSLGSIPSGRTFFIPNNLIFKLHASQVIYMIQLETI